MINTVCGCVYLYDDFPDVFSACAHIFYRSGAKVILAARRITELERVANDLKASKCVSLFFELYNGKSNLTCQG